MTANELLALLGRAWLRLLIYPGGLTAFSVIWLMIALQNREPPRGYPTENREPRTGEPENRRTENQESGHLGGSWFLVLSSIVLPWLAIALLPLPLAVALPRQIDIVVTLALLEWPNLLAIRQDLRAGDMRRLAAALNSYPPLILATLALAQAGNSLELAALARTPGSLAATSMSALHWLGMIALALALAPALGIGPFANGREPRTKNRRTENRRTENKEQRTKNNLQRTTDNIGLWLRALGLVTLAALPWAGAEGTGLALLRMLGAAALIAALLWGYDRLTRGRAARRWAWAYLGLDAVLLLALLGAAYLALQIRLA